VDKISESPEMVADEAYKALNNGKVVVVTGLFNKPLPVINRLIPRKTMTWAVGKMMGR
jgi:short-subunit dehydrogenase